MRANGLIPVKNAMILWGYSKEINEKGIRLVSCFKVHYQCRPDEWEPTDDFDDLDFDHHCRRLKYRYHECSCWWGIGSGFPEMTLENQICSVLGLLLQEDFDQNMIKKALFELGKIKEFDAIRRMYHQKYLNCDMSFNGLMNSYYDLDFCDGY